MDEEEDEEDELLMLSADGVATHRLRLRQRVQLNLALKLDRHRNRFALPRSSLTGIANSSWRTLFHDRNHNAFVTSLALSPAVFDELLAVVRCASCSLRLFAY